MIARRSFIAGAAASLPILARAQAVAKPVKLGILTDLSSIFTDYTGKGSITAIQMAVDDFGGKALDMPIEIVTADHQNKPDVALTIARKWFDVDGVDAILDVGNSGIAASVGALGRRAGPPDADRRRFVGPHLRILHADPG